MNPIVYNIIAYLYNSNYHHNDKVSSTKNEMHYQLFPNFSWNHPYINRSGGFDCSIGIMFSSDIGNTATIFSPHELHFLDK